jgi:hypothetical protein
MAETKQSRLQEILHAVDWIKGDALWDGIKWLVGPGLGGWGFARLRNEPLGTAFNAAFVLLGIFLLASVAFKRRHVSPKSANTLPLRLLLLKCSDLLATYRRLDHDSRDEVRYPLKGSSWPSFGDKWNYV